MIKKFFGKYEYFFKKVLTKEKDGDIIAIRDVN